MGKTSTQVKDKYNENTYKRFTVRIRKDDWLLDDIERFLEDNRKNGASFNGLVEELLRKNFRGW